MTKDDFIQRAVIAMLANPKITTSYDFDAASLQTLLISGAEELYDRLREHGLT